MKEVRDVTIKILAETSIAALIQKEAALKSNLLH
jgi:hypothetical protein